jgi:predicted transcriptional regulator
MDTHPLQAALDLLGLSQAECARRAGCGQPTISLVCGGRNRRPRLSSEIAVRVLSVLQKEAEAQSKAVALTLEDLVLSRDQARKLHPVLRPRVLRAKPRKAVR